MASFEMAVSGTLVVFLVCCLIYCLFKKIKIRLHYLLLSFLTFLIPLSPIFIYDLTHNFNNTHGIIKLLTTSGNHASQNLIFNFFSIFINRFSVFGWNFISTFSPQLIIWFPLLILTIIGIVRFIKDEKRSSERRSFITCLSLIPIFTFVFLMLYPDKQFAQWWIIDLVIIYCLLLGISLNYLRKSLKYLIILLVIILGFAALDRTYFIYKTQFVYPTDSYIKVNVAINYAYKDSGNKPFGIIIFPDRPCEDVDYLIWWQSKIKYHYVPYKIKTGLYYVIIEPQLQKALAETNLNFPGKLIKINKLGNGFIVEKFIN